MNATFVVGSANATNAALRAGSNVEFLCALTGKYSQTSTPEKIIGTEGIGQILVPYARSDRKIDSGSQALREVLETSRDLLADAELEATCIPNGSGAWSISVTSIPTAYPQGVELRIWPATQLPSQAQLCLGQNALCFAPLAAAEITAIFGSNCPLKGKNCHLRARSPCRVHLPSGRPKSS